MTDENRARANALSAGNRLLAEHAEEDPFAAAIKATRMPMLITDPRQPDNPIIFCNSAFLKFTGYTLEETIGFNCRFLQGPDTDPDVVASIRAAIAADEPVSANILNYRKDGTPFWNALFISPVHDAAGRTMYFFASQLDFTQVKEKEQALETAQEHAEREVEKRTAELRAALDAKTILLHEVDHRVKNNLLTIASLLKLEVRQTESEIAIQTLSSVLGRIEALSTVQRKLFTEDDVSRFDVADFVRELIEELLSDGNGKRPQLTLSLSPVWVPAAKASPLALMIHELLCLALRPHDAEREARLDCEVRRLNGHFIISIRDGHSFQQAITRSFGRVIVDTCARQLSASLDWHAWEHGTAVDITLPVGTFIEE